MSDLIKIDTDTLEDKIKELEEAQAYLTSKVDDLEDYLQDKAQCEEPAGSDMLAKFMTQDEIIELVNEILREATISIDV